MAVGVRGECQTQIADLCDLIAIERGLVSKRPSQIMDWVMAIGFLKERQQGGPDARDPNPARRRLDQECGERLTW